MRSKSIKNQEVTLSDLCIRICLAGEEWSALDRRSSESVDGCPTDLSAVALAKEEVVDFESPA